MKKNTLLGRVRSPTYLAHPRVGPVFFLFMNQLTCKGTINPFIPNMAFMGYVESVSNLHTSEIRCKWLARLIGGKFNLPSVEKMVEQITREMEIMNIGI
ncbi:putative flavin-containing monooxygenase [Helianthus anomalus]